MITSFMCKTIQWIRLQTKTLVSWWVHQHSICIEYFISMNRHAPNSNYSSRFDPNSSSSSSRSSSIWEFGFEFEFDLRVRVRVRVRVRDLKFGFGFEFENYPINLASIECLSGSPSIFLWYVINYEGILSSAGLEFEFGYFQT